MRGSHTPRGNPQLLLVCSSGGHLLELLALADAWSGIECLWITFGRGDSEFLLRGQDVVHAHGPTNRNIPNLIRNLVLAGSVIRQSQARALITTGAGVAVPFVWIARLHGVKTVYVERLTRIDRPSLTLRLIRPAANRIYVQWPELAVCVRRARYAGSIFGRAS